MHSALNNLLKKPEYNIHAATLISNERKFYQEDKVIYMPVYFVMFMEADTPQTDENTTFSKCFANTRANIRIMDIISRFLQNLPVRPVPASVPE